METAEIRFNPHDINRKGTIQHDSPVGYLEHFLKSFAAFVVARAP